MEQSSYQQVIMGCNNQERCNLDKMDPYILYQREKGTTSKYTCKGLLVGKENIGCKEMVSEHGP